MITTEKFNDHKYCCRPDGEESFIGQPKLISREIGSLTQYGQRFIQQHGFFHINIILKPEPNLKIEPEILDWIINLDYPVKYCSLPKNFYFPYSVKSQTMDTTAKSNMVLNTTYRYLVEHFGPENYTWFLFMGNVYFVNESDAVIFKLEDL